MSNLLKDYIARVKGSDVFANFDGIMTGMKSRLPDRDGASGSSLIAWQLYEFARDHFYMMLVSERKLGEMAKGLDAALSEGNMSVFLTLSRSFLEHMACLAYQEDLLAKALADFPKSHSDDAITATIANHSGRLKKLFYSSAKEGDKVHVNKMIGVVEDKNAELAARYGDLCEFVHPNYGSNRLVSSGTLGEGHLDAPSTLFDEERVRALDTLDQCIKLVQDCQIGIGRNLIELDTRIRIASEGGRSTQIFTNKVDHAGDGKSKETALFFQRARSHFEAMKGFYDYVEKNGIMFNQAPRKLIEEGHLYEAYNTNKGTVWVKFTMKL